LSGGYEAACALLGLPVGVTSTREGTKKMSAEEARELLKEALRKVPAGSLKGQPNATSKPSEPARKWTSRVAAGRGADRVELSDLLYWKK